MEKVGAKPSFSSTDHTQSQGRLNSAVKSFGRYIEKIIESSGPDFGSTAMGKSLQKVWSHIKSTEVSESDTTTQSIKKVAFNVFVSLPSIFLFKEVIAASEVKFAKVSDLFNIKNLAQVALFLYIVLPIINFLERHFTPQETTSADMEMSDEFLEDLVGDEIFGESLHAHEDALKANDEDLETASSTLGCSEGQIGSLDPNNFAFFIVLVLYAHSMAVDAELD